MIYAAQCLNSLVEKARNKVGWEEDGKQATKQIVPNGKPQEQQNSNTKRSEQCMSFNACEMAKSYTC